MRCRRTPGFFPFLVATLIGVATAQQRQASRPSSVTWPGSRPDGTILLPNGWSLDPHGKTVALPHDLPVRLAWHPGGRFLAVQHVGYRAHGVTIVDGKDQRVVLEIPLGRSWSGMAWNVTGDRLWVSGGVDDVAHEIAFDAERLTAKHLRAHPVGDPARLDVPSGLCFAGKDQLYTALHRGNELARLADEHGSERRVALPDGAFPFEVVAAIDRKTVFVSLWAKGEVRGYDADTLQEVLVAKCGEHPSEMLPSQDGKRLFVSNGNENTVTVLDLATGTVDETLDSALFPTAPPGATPNSLALAPDGKTLWIANADNNDCAVIDVSERRRARSLGFVPVGWYPTAVRFSPDGGTLWVANGKGGRGSAANPELAQPGEKGRKNHADQYTGGMFTGTLSVFPVPTALALRALTARVYATAPLDAAGRARDLDRRPADSPIPARIGDPSPITHVIYVVKENRTYDQVFGDDPRGNGAPALCLFPEAVTPNHHAIAREFVLLDNFYVESEVSADGHEWTMGAYASDFVERTWPVTYGGKGTAKVENGRPVALGYPSEGGYALARPKNGYLWDRAKAAGVDYFSFGEFVENGATPADPGRARLPVLEGHFDPLFRSFDLDYEDVARAERFQTKLAERDKVGAMPHLVVLRLPNDHTSAGAAGKIAPRSAVADNDLALGRVLEALSASRFWPHLAVFVVEDDAQNGPDHVDAHRSVGLVAGPWVARGAVVSTMYSTCSMLRTMELILGLEPLSQFDAAARPMWECFTGTPDLRRYGARPATWPLHERNGKTGKAAELSAPLDLTREDAADDFAFLAALWTTLRGEHGPVPAPRRAAFVRAFEPQEDDDDDEEEDHGKRR